jgi:fatty-acyl-CoA synthase
VTPPDRSLQSEIARRLEEAPDQPALTFFDPSGGWRWLSFAELHRRASCCAGHLQDRGLRPGDVCVLVMPSDQHACDAILGVLLAGGVPVSVAPPVVRGLHSNLAEVVRHVVRTTAARAVLIGEEGWPLGAELAARRPGLAVIKAPNAWAHASPDAMTPALPAGDAVAALQLTSGTTGFPRVCVWDQKAVLAALDGMEAAMGLTADDVCVNWTPLYHDMGLVNNFLLCLVKRVPLVMLETMAFLKRPSSWLRALFETRATTTWSPNFGFALMTRRVSDRELDGIDLAGVKGFWNAAERIHLETMRAFHERFARFGVSMAALKTNFGCAENVGGATFSDPNGTFVVEHVDRQALHQEGLARPPADHRSNDAVSVVGVGRPYPGMRIEILSDRGRPLADGRIGRIALATPSRMRGYLNNAAETRRAIRGDFVLTGDLGYKRGEELFWVGRARERINLQGKKYDPSDFEKAVFGVAGLREGCFAAFGVDDARLGTQKLVIVAERRQDNGRPDDELIDDLKEEMARHVGVTVHDVVLLEQGTMTKTSSGKRRHRHYRQLYADGALDPARFAHSSPA